MKPSQVAYMAEEPEEPGSKPGPAHISVETDHEIFSTTNFPLSLIQDGRLSTTYCVLFKSMKSKRGKQPYQQGSQPAEHTTIKLYHV